MRFLVFAYLDPGSGSLILQILIGAVAGFFFAIKAYWIKIKSFFGSRSKNSPKG